MKRISLQLILPTIGVATVSAVAIYGLVRPSQPPAPVNKAPITCRQTNINHTVIIQDDKVSPNHTDGHLCDTLTIKNLDSVTRFIAFGQHDHHQPYDGITKDTLNQNESFTITMDQAGEFMFHDHAHDEVEGTFSVQ
jgi:plastocyanin